MAFWSMNTLKTFLPVIGQAASGVMSAQASLNQGKMDHALANYNARIDEVNASRVMEKGYRDQEALRRNFDKFRGQQKAAIGKSGVAFSGSVLDVLADSAAEAELDAMNIKFNAMREAAGLESDAAMTRATGDIARSQSRMRATGELIDTAGRVYETGHRTGAW